MTDPADTTPTLGVTPYGDRVLRVPEHDLNGEEAWRLVEPCDDRCHHPVHAFNKPDRLRHLTWWAAGLVRPASLAQPDGPVRA